MFLSKTKVYVLVTVLPQRQRQVEVVRRAVTQLQLKRRVLYMHKSHQIGAMAGSRPPIDHSSGG